MSRYRDREEYQPTEKELQAWQNQFKTFSMLSENEELFNLFRDSKYPDWEADSKQKASWLQYKSRVGNFLDQLNKPIQEVTAEDIKTYLDKKGNAKNFINGFLLFLLNNNVKGFRESVRKDVLFHLLNII